FALQGLNAAPVSPEQLRGRWNLLFFGFTHCPDICPTTLYHLTQSQQQLSDLPTVRQPQIWLVSVDPARDTPDVLQQYLAHFSSEIRGLTGPDAEIEKLATALGVAYQRINTEDSYTMSHTAAIFLVDPSANYVALFTAPHDYGVIASDYRLLTK
ncbi:MAG: SCO family protein, partial [Gammaproteobacteria bacterium]|nr:SCO family protein [Gammaproteobacteria bacterium]